MLGGILEARGIHERSTADNAFQLVGFDEKANLPGETVNGHRRRVWMRQRATRNYLFLKRQRSPAVKTRPSCSITS